MGVVVTTWHPTPLYGVETDLLGEYVPAAQELRAGHLSAEHYQFKGFGYPLALAAVSAALGGDDYLGARWLKRTW